MAYYNGKEVLFGAKAVNVMVDGPEDAVLYNTPQELTYAQKRQARENIGAVADEVIAQAIADMQPVRFTVTKQDGKYVSSKTFEELTDILAENEHRSIICEIDGYDVPLCNVTRLSLYFSLAITTWNYVSVQLASTGDTTSVTVIRDYPSIEINGQLWDEEDPNADFTGTINDMIDAKVSGIDDEQIAAHITSWMNEHPEATTSVQDHSLTIDKMVVGTLGYVTPQMFGAKGDGKTDDTAAIQAAMDAHHNVYIPAGTYLVDGYYKDFLDSPNGGIKLHTGQRVYMDTECAIQVKTNNGAFYNAFNVTDCYNVEIHGGHIIGERNEHDPDTHAANPNRTQGFGIAVQNSDTVLIENVDISEMWGDAIVLHTPDNLSGYNTNITIRDCNLHECERQGISVVVGDNVLISNCTIGVISGHAPQSGIDLEPSSDAVEMYLHDITIENCRLTENVQSLCFSKCYNLTVHNCVFSGGWSEGHTLGQIASEGYCHNVKFNNCTLNSFVADSNSDVSFYGCDIGCSNNVDNENTGLKTTLRYYDCRFSGERTGTGGRVRAVLTRIGGEHYFHNCEFAVKVVNETVDSFVYGAGFCQFDGCKFGTIDDKKVMRFNDNNTSFRFNNCHFDVNCANAYPQMFLNPVDTIMQDCYVKTNGFTFTYTPDAVNSYLLVSGNIFERSGTNDYILHIGNNVYAGEVVPEHSIALVNNTCTNSANNFVRNWSKDAVTVTDINNNKI